MKKYLIILLLVVVLSSTDFDYEKYDADEEKCYGINSPTEDSCTSVELEISDAQCCFTNYSHYCYFLTDDDYLDMTSSQVKAAEREKDGFEYVNDPETEYESDSETTSYKFQFKCQKRNFDWEYSTSYSFSTKEKETFAKDNYCLKINDKFEKGKITTIKKSDCTGALLTDYAKENEISCAFYDYKVKLINKTSTHFTFCDFFYPDQLKYSENYIKMGLSENVGEFFDEDDDPSILAFTVEVSTSSGKQISYDSTTGKITKDSKTISLSKYLFLLLLISLL